MPRLNADTSSQPEGITRRVVLNVLEAFFRRPWLHLLPLIVLTAVGVATAFNHDDRYRSVATMSSTNDSLLSDLTATNSTAFTFQSPAQRAASQLTILLGIDGFVDGIAQRADVRIGDQNGQLTIGEVRNAITTTVRSDTLVQVTAATLDSERSRKLADATVDAYIDYVADSSAEEGNKTAESLGSLVDEARDDRDEANQAVTDYLQLHPNAEAEFADPVQVQDLHLLRLDLDQAVQSYSEVRAAQVRAQLGEGTASDVVRQRNVKLIPAAAGQKSASVLRTALLTVTVFVVLGMLLTLASAVATAMLDRTIRVPEDIRSRFGLDVLAVVPDMNR